MHRPTGVLGGSARVARVARLATAIDASGAWVDDHDEGLGDGELALAEVGVVRQAKGAARADE
eukprot:15129727-Alexandrium_andersonii.AAC.1